MNRPRSGLQARSLGESSAGSTRRTAQDFVSAIRRSLASGKHLDARRLAEEGARSHSDNEELRKFAQLLSPPVVKRNPDSTSLGATANRKWLGKHAKQHRGKWVALRDGKLLAVASTASQLREQLTDFQKILMTKVI